MPRLVHAALRLGLALAASCATVAQAKTVRGSFQLEAGDFDSGPEYEITKYSFATGVSKIDGTFRYKDPHTWMTSPALYLFKDDAWDKYHTAPACTDKVELANAMIPIGKLTQSHRDILHVGVGRANHSAMRELEDGYVEWEFTWVIEHHVRTYGWFVIVADCALEQYNAKVSPMSFELHLFNPGNTHLPADEHGLPKMYLFTFVAMSAYLVYLLKLLRSHYEETRRIHLVVRLLLVAFIFQLTSVACELGHLFVYKSNGTGIFILDLLSEMFEGFSQTIISFVLICLASGWTLVETASDENRGNSVATMLNNPSLMLRGPNVAIFFIILLVIVSMFLQIANKNLDDDFSKFHDHESTPGRILVAIRSVLGLAFILSLHVTIKSQRLRGGQLIPFLQSLMLLGGLWFLSFPLVVFLAGFFAHYLRHRFVTTGVLILQTASLATLGHQFLSNHSTYFKLSTLADSGVLPGAAGMNRAPKASKD
mmetsp:Transcript_19478/g.55704  ORF Transcript_19478/g.55704 Transcript_19478/m.55704 type:complete len:482 (+) Transcript_19478:122-1567(+)